MNKGTPNKAYKNAICVSVGLLIIFTTSIFVAKDFFGNQIRDLIDDSTLLKEYRSIYLVLDMLIGVNSLGIYLLATPTRSVLLIIQKVIPDKQWHPESWSLTIPINTRILALGRAIKALLGICMIGSSNQHTLSQHRRLPQLTWKLRELAHTKNMHLHRENLLSTITIFGTVFNPLSLNFMPINFTTFISNINKL
jgi:hypothetical protein